MLSGMLPAALIAAAFFVGACKQGDSPDTAKSAKAPPPLEGWAVYEDEAIRFEYPKDWPFREPKKDTPPAHRGFTLRYAEFLDMLGSPADILIVNQKILPNARLLRERVAERMAGLKKEGVRIWKKPESLALGAGRCFYYSTEKPAPPSDYKCKMHDGREGPCLQIWLMAECKTDNNRHVDFQTQLFPYATPGQPGEKAKDQIQVFDRLLRSVKFKKVTQEG